METFATRDEELADLVRLYEPAVDEALDMPAEEQRAERTALLVAALTTLFLATYGDEGGDPSRADEFAAVFVKAMEAAVDLMTPEVGEDGELIGRESDDPAAASRARDTQRDRMTEWFATATLGAATLYAAESKPTDTKWVKTWVTRRDDRVRDTHVPLDGETKDVGDVFVVKTTPEARMQYPGQPVGPIEAWINCRCVLSISEVSMTAAAEKKSGFSGVVLVALPEGDETITYNDGDTTELHQTLAYLGTIDQLQDGERDEVLRVAENLASQFQPFTARIAGLGTLGKDQDGIAITESRELQDLHEMARDSAIIDRMYSERNEHPTWISHITAGTLQPGDEVRFDRIGAWFGGDDHVTFAMGEPGGEIPLENPPAVLGDEPMDDEMMDDDELPEPSEPLAPEDDEMPVWGVAAPEGVESGDGRMFALDSLTWRDLPLPLTWQRADMGEHQGKVIVGRVDNFERVDNLIYWDGVLLPDVDETEEVIALISQGALRGVSVDADQGTAHVPSDEDLEAAMESGQPMTDVWDAARISGLTIVQIPAFTEAFIVLGERPGTEVQEDLEPVEEAPSFEPETGTFRDYDTEARKRMADAGTAMPDGSYPIADLEDLRNAIQAIGRAKDPDAVKRHIRKRAKALDAENLLPDTWAARVESFKRGTGWITHPEETRRIHDYWVRGKGAAKIRWGTPGDFTRLVRHLRKYIEPRFLYRTAAQWHHDALGYWPGQCGLPGNPPCGAKRGVPGVPGAQSDTIEAAQETDMTPALTLVAAAPPAIIDRTWFDNPGFTGPTPLSVDTKTGRLSGHIATWGTCHIGIDKVCVTPPKSKTDYAHFHLGVVNTTDGELSVGSLTLGTGHADLNMSANDTRRHYDHTGTAVAKVRAGEDEHGIWVAGALCEGVTEEQARTLAAAGGISGDWRSIGGNLELVAGLAVNVPGFPVPRPALAASGERQTALVAAGVVVANADVNTFANVDELAEAVVDKIERRQKRREVLASLSPLADEVRQKRLNALADLEASV